MGKRRAGSSRSLWRRWFREHQRSRMARPTRPATPSRTVSAARKFMDPALRQRTISGIVWSAMSRAAIELFQLTVAIVLARLLTPRDFGLVGMVTIFTGFAHLFADFGFSSALIQREQLRAEHPSSVFWLNVLAGSLLALLAVAAGPLVVSFYGEESLGSLTALIGVSFFITSLGLVHRALLRRELLFRRLA